MKNQEESKATGMALQIEEFRQKQGLVHNQLAVRTGISTTNIKRVLVNGSSLHLAMAVRLFAALKEDGITEYIYGQSGFNKRSINQTISENPQVFTLIDYSMLMIVLLDYFTLRNQNGAEDILQKLFYVLTDELAKSEVLYRPSAEPNKYELTDLKGMSNSNDPDMRLLYYFLRSYYQPSFLVPKFASDENTEKLMPTDWLRGIMIDGGVITWWDVRDIIRKYKNDYGYLTKDFKKNDVVHRIENLNNNSYVCEDIMIIDSMMEMGGAFFCECFNATKNDIVFDKYMDMAFPSMDTAQKKKMETKMNYGLRSFFSMYRYLEFLTDKNAVKKVLATLRDEFFREENKKFHRNLAAVNRCLPRIFPCISEPEKL